MSSATQVTRRTLERQLLIVFAHLWSQMLHEDNEDLQYCSHGSAKGFGSGLMGFLSPGRASQQRSFS